MSLFDVTTWGTKSSMLQYIPKIINNFIALKSEIDGARAGLSIKTPALVASTGNLTLSGLQTIDGVALAVNDRVLVKDQTTASENGIYTAQTGSWTRVDDALVTGTAIWITSGTVNGSTRYVLTTEGAITVGTTALSFTLDLQNTNIVVGAGLLKEGNQIELVETTKAEEAAASAANAAQSEKNAKTSETGAAASNASATASAAAALAQKNLILNADFDFSASGTLSITYNANGTINTLSDGTTTKTCGYNTAGQLITLT